MRKFLVRLWDTLKKALGLSARMESARRKAEMMARAMEIKNTKEGDTVNLVQD